MQVSQFHNEQVARLQGHISALSIAIALLIEKSGSFEISEHVCSIDPKIPDFPQNLNDAFREGFDSIKIEFGRIMSGKPPQIGF